MTEDIFPRKVLEWVPPGRRRRRRRRRIRRRRRRRRGRGRPRITWIDVVLSCMREKGLEEGDWSDTERWRRMTVD